MSPSPLLSLAFQLLRDPLTQQRTSFAASILEYASLPLMVVMPVAEQQSAVALLQGGAASRSACHRPHACVKRKALILPTALHPGKCCLQYGTDASGAPLLPCAGGAPAGQACRATLSFVQVALGLLLPLLVSFCCWRPLDKEADAEHAEQPGDGAQTAAGRRPPAGRPLRLSIRASKAAAAANDALCFVLRGPSRLDSGALVCWWLLAFTWWLCKLAAGLH